MSNTPKHHYTAIEGINISVVEADSVGVVVDGITYELQFRKSDGTVSLSVSRGALVITPVASNVVRIGNQQS